MIYIAVVAHVALLLAAETSPNAHVSECSARNVMSEMPHMSGLPQQPRSRTQGKGNWAKWRGPMGTGEAPGGNPPIKWSESKNIRWKVELPGRGSSTPVIWKDRIYLTSAIETDEEGKAPARSGRRSSGGRSERNQPGTKVYDFRVIALNRKNGSVIWSKSINKAVPHERGHRTSSQASASPVTDGKHIYAHFGSRGIHCLDMSGKIKWSKDFGLMETRNGFGEGSSPALWGDKVIVVWDHEGESFVCALNKRNGKQVWRTSRREATSWSTPVVTEVGRKTQVIIAATRASCGYDLKSGDEVWRCTGMTKNVICTPVVHDGIAWLMSGLKGSMLQAVKLAGAKGDITGGKNLLWSHTRQTSYVPSPLVYDGRIWFLRVGHGVLSCLDARTGEVFYEGQRLSGLKTVYASPVAASGRVYITSREGKTVVLKASDKFDALATNQLDDSFDASPIILGKEMFLRGHKSLYCIAK
ncbi:MAG: outer membrane protein assembly factor BamB [Planctomycetota bacterium]|jgi:outer membrane protein assembly factor BamB